MRSQIQQFLVKRLPFSVVRKIGRAYSRTANLLKYGDFWFPSAIHIETSQYCNRSCWYCSRTERPSMRGRMTEDLFALAIHRLEEINWTGPVGYHFENEPTLNPNLFSQISMTKRVLPRSVPTLVTNGDYLTPDYMDRLVECGVGRVIISRHPPFTDEWDRCISYLRSCYPHLITMTQVGKTIPVHTNDQMKHGGIPWQGHCIAPSLCFTIRMNGDVSLCGCDIDRKAVFGNIESAGIMQIWNRPAFKDMRRRLRAGERDVHPICKGCSGMI